MIALAINLTGPQGGTAQTATPASGDPLAETEALIARLVEESQKHKVPRKMDPKDPIWRAEQFATGLADDIPVFNHWMLKIVGAYASRGDAGEADYLADQLPGAGSPMAHGDLAVFYARQGKTADAERHLKTATAGVSMNIRLQADAVRARCAHALHLLGRPAEAAALEARMEELELLSLESRLHEESLRPALTLKEAQTRLNGIRAKGADEARCRFLLACARQHVVNGDAAAGLPFLPEVGTLASTNGLPPAQHVLIDLARTARQAGQEAEARKALNLFLKCCERYADEAEWKAPYLADAAEVLLDWQEAAQARAWLKIAESALNKIYVLDAPAAILAVGRQFERLDGTAVGDRFALMAAQAGMTHPHPRAQAAAAVQICLFYSEAGRAVPAAVLAILSPEDREASK